MKVNNIPDCCAGYLFTGFGYTNTAVSGSAKHNLKDVNRWLATEEKRWGYNCAFAEIFLNQDQRKVYHKLLKKRGYRCVIANMYHPGHKSRVFLYIKKFHDK